MDFNMDFKRNFCIETKDRKCACFLLMFTLSGEPEASISGVIEGSQ
jgi:hypothetical protein